MKCVKCSKPTEVIDSRPNKFGTRRIRDCGAHRFSTQELKVKKHNHAKSFESINLKKIGFTISKLKNDLSDLENLITGDLKGLQANKLSIIHYK